MLQVAQKPADDPRLVGPDVATFRAYNHDGVVRPGHELAVFGLLSTERSRRHTDSSVLHIPPKAATRALTAYPTHPYENTTGVSFSPHS